MLFSFILHFYTIEARVMGLAHCAMHSLKDLFKSFSEVIYFFDFEINEVCFLNKLTGASLLWGDFVKKQI